MTREAQLTNGTDKARHEEVVEARATAFPNPTEVNMYRNYARGKQKNTLTREQLRYLRGQRIILVENVLKRVLTVLTDRIHVTGYEVADGAVEAFLKDLWVRNWLSALYTQITYTAWRDGNVGATLEWNQASARPTVTRVLWWNGRRGLFMAYSDTGEPLYAVNEWNSAQGRRRTIAYPGEIRRYIVRNGAWQYYAEPGREAGPIEWLDSKRQPLGIPAVHFARRVEPADSDEEDKDNDGDGNYGVSMFAGGLIGLQDVVNEKHKLILAASRFTAFQIPWGSGVDAPKDERTQEQKDVKVEPGTMLTAADPAARFGHIPAGSIEQLLKGLDNDLRAIAASAVVPEHTIKGQWPSGEALMRAEMPLIDQARKAAAVVGPPFASIAHKCIKLANYFGGQGLNEAALITTRFEPPERYDPLTLTNLANQRAQYVSLAEVWRLYGYSRDRQQQIRREMQEEASFRKPDDGADQGQGDAAEANAALFDAADDEDAAALS